MKKPHLLITSALLCCASYTMACTNFLFTKGATKDGSTMVTYAADSHTLYGELYHYPAADWPEGSMLDVYDWDTGKFMGRIPQVAHTYNVIGNMNEHQLAIAESTYGGREELCSQSGAIMDYGSAIYITLQRAKNAREAIVVMTKLFEDYGYASAGESFSIVDPNEVWILEAIGKGEGETGAVWVARMVPDGYVSGHANQARITTFPLEGRTSISSDKMDKIYNPEITTVYSKDVISFAKEKGYYPREAKNKDFSFSDTYNPVTFGGARGCEIRVWSFFKSVNKDMQQYFGYASGRDIQYDDKGYATNRMPLWIQPDEKVDVQQVMDFMRDHLEGTELDMTKDLGAGPYEWPYRWRPMDFEVDGKKYVQERATATQQTGFSFVAQCRSWLPDEIGGIIWFGVDDAASSVYFPMYTSSTRVPRSFAQGNGSMMEFTNEAAFWVFNQVTNFAYSRYKDMIVDIQKVQSELETGFQSKVAQNDAKMKDETDPAKLVAFANQFSNAQAELMFNQWKSLSEYLLVKYMDGNVKKTDEKGNFKTTPYGPDRIEMPDMPLYPESWYREIVEDCGENIKVK